MVVALGHFHFLFFEWLLLLLFSWVFISFIQSGIYIDHSFIDRERGKQKERNGGWWARKAFNGWIETRETESVEEGGWKKGEEGKEGGQKKRVSRRGRRWVGGKKRIVSRRRGKKKRKKEREEEKRKD